ncbi:TonB-dependent receptor [Flavobacterium sp.]|uniref:TonB-dependent receptor n=1 Tax=Flavobacterium sp. TaxID=239 RepID=UPI00262A817A|nr:TonB-dependent receptor [Flavobacterium sp.]
MKINFQYKIAIVTVLLGTQFTVAQKKDENIGTEVVNVVKPYTATISDAFKVKETPSLEDDETSKKENIQYNIFSFPVASTFTPSKGKAAGVDKAAQEKIYNNYATLAAGNYGNINAELFVTQTLENNNYIGAMLRHLSSQGGIKDLVLDDKFSNSSLDLTYGSRSRTLSWNADLGYQRQMYNWYGLNPLFSENLVAADRDAFINGIDSKQTYQNISLGGRLQLGESVLKEATIKFNRFSDAFSSGENRLVIKPSLGLDIMDEKIKVDFVLDYINGKFDKDYNALTELKYGYTSFGVKPSFQINREDLSVNFGAGFFYSMATESGKNKFFIYPNITASYKVVGDLMVAYAGAEGALKQNSFQDFVQQNFFVSPTLGIAPTDQKFDIYVGLKGKLANTIGYNIRGSIMNEGAKPMFLRNQFSFSNANKNGYAFGNSFDVVYDDVKTVSFYGELKADFSKNVSFGVNGTFSSYTTDTQAEAWNLPSLQLGANLDFNITDKWYAGTSVFFVGERKDLKFVQGLTAVYPPTYGTETTTLDSYFDLNAHVGYKYSDRLTFFLKGNNLANQNYQRWINYPVQGVQGLIGANYKFDF